MAKLSKKDRRAREKAFREQVKPLSVSLMDQAKNFYRAVGQGISHWASMEGRLVQIVAKLTRTSEDKAGLIVYSINNFHTWINIIDELFVLDGTYKRSLKAWRKLIEPLKKENDIRVRLAHQSLSQEDVDPGEELRMVAARLRPGKLDTRMKSKKAKPLEMMEIAEFTERVNDLHDKLISLLALMKKRKSLR
jgi:hypothetical protein